MRGIYGGGEVPWGADGHQEGCCVNQWARASRERALSLTVGMSEGLLLSFLPTGSSFGPSEVSNDFSASSSKSRRSTRRSPYRNALLCHVG